MNKRMANANALDIHKSIPNWGFGTAVMVEALAKIKTFAKYNV